MLWDCIVTAVLSACISKKTTLLKLFPYEAIAEAPAVQTKLNPFATSDQSKNHKGHCNAPSHIRRKMMFSPLSEELRQKDNVRSKPIWKDGEVQVVRGQ